jgi:ABC-2 type transport system permease protein
MLFGTGDLMVLNGNGLTIFHEGDIIWRFACGFSLALLSLLMVATLSLTLSCFSENSIGPIVSTMAIIILFNIISALDIPVLQKLHPYLFTNYMTAWRNFFEGVIPYNKIFKSVLVLSIHIIGLLSIAVYKFSNKNILS